MDNPPRAADAGATRFSDSDPQTLYWLRRFNIRLIPMYPESGRLVRLIRTDRQVGRNVAYLSSHQIHGLIMHPDDWESQYRSLIATTAKFVENNLRPTWYRASDGASRLPEALSATLESNLRLNSVVTSIAQGSNGVDVYANKLKFPFDRVVVTAPTSVYDRIEFKPRLPSNTLECTCAVRRHSHRCVFSSLFEGSRGKQAAFVGGGAPMRE